MSERVNQDHDTLTPDERQALRYVLAWAHEKARGNNTPTQDLPDEKENLNALRGGKKVSKERARWAAGLVLKNLTDEENPMIAHSTDDSDIEAGYPSRFVGAVRDMYDLKRTMPFVDAVDPTQYLDARFDRDPAKTAAESVDRQKEQAESANTVERQQVVSGLIGDDPSLAKQAIDRALSRLDDDKVALIGLQDGS